MINYALQIPFPMSVFSETSRMTRSGVRLAERVQTNLKQAYLSTRLAALRGLKDSDVLVIKPGSGTAVVDEFIRSHGALPTATQIDALAGKLRMSLYQQSSLTPRST